LEDFDITNALFFGTERRFVGRNFTTCWWIPYKIWWFYRKSEYLRFSCDYYSKFDKSIKKTDIDWHLSEEEILVKRLA
jgi:hypothetical protein